MSKLETSYFPTGKSEIYFNKVGQIHRANGLAAVYYYNNGNVRSQSYIINGRHSNKNGPAYIQYYESGGIKQEEYKVDGKLHRDGDQPALIFYNEDGEITGERWWKNGTAWRENGAALVNYKNSKVVKTDRHFQNRVRV